MSSRLGILVASLWLSSMASAGPIVSIPGAVDQRGTLARRQLWRVPSTDPDVLMFTTVFRPSGSGPFPLVVMNHGTTQNPVQRQYFPLLEFQAAALWFVRQGFVVAAPSAPATAKPAAFTWRTWMTAAAPGSWQRGAPGQPT